MLCLGVRKLRGKSEHIVQCQTKVYLRLFHQLFLKLSSVTCKMMVST